MLHVHIHRLLGAFHVIFGGCKHLCSIRLRNRKPRTSSLVSHPLQFGLQWQMLRREGLHGEDVQIKYIVSHSILFYCCLQSTKIVFLPRFITCFKHTNSTKRIQLCIHLASFPLDSILPLLVAIKSFSTKIVPTICFKWKNIF